MAELAVAGRSDAAALAARGLEIARALGDDTAVNEFEALVATSPSGCRRTSPWGSGPTRSSSAPRPTDQPQQPPSPSRWPTVPTTTAEASLRHLAAQLLAAAGAVPEAIDHVWRGLGLAQTADDPRAVAAFESLLAQLLA